MKRSLITALGICLLILAILGFNIPQRAKAGTTITVNSTSDVVANDGACTLREAIIAANTDASSGVAANECTAGSGADTIEFALTGPADFTIQSQDGYIISPESALPTITSQVTIDGYSQNQAGSIAAPNTATSPDPFNGALVVEIDGSLLPGIGTDSCIDINGADGVLIRGLVIGNCAADGIHILHSQNTSITGNYIGVDYTGNVALRNGRNGTSTANGSGIYMTGVNHTTIGGLAPEDRNIIAGNQFGDIWSESSYKGDDENHALTNSYTTIQGNYTGLGADGLTVLPSGYAIGHGNSILLSHSGNDVIGGTATGATNVIAASLEFGISFRGGSSNGVIQGNFIGTNYTGQAAALHPDGALDCDPNGSNPCGSSGNSSSGISLATISGGGYKLPTHDFLIGGSANGSKNVISGNKYYGVQNVDGIVLHDQTYNVTVQGNNIGVGADNTAAVANDDDGVQVGGGDIDGVAATHGILIGGTNANEANRIANNGSKGVALFDSPTRATILRNSIYNNGGLGIDLGFAGVAHNDPLDADHGTNELLNFPEYNNINEAAGNTTVDFRTDLPAGTYRIEFFSNTVADPSGNGEGQTFLGATQITSSGTGIEQNSYILTGVTGVANLALTATLVDNSTPSGFNQTSEFGGAYTPIADAAITKTILNPNGVSKGGHIDYQVTYTNNGPDELDLTQFSHVLTGTPLFIDFSPPGLTAADNIAAGPIPNSYYINAGNTDLTCLWAGAGSGGSIYGLADHGTYAATLCWYTGVATELISGQSSVANISYAVSNDSDLHFTNYAVASQGAHDPDDSSIQAVYNTNDIITGFLEANSPINNFAQAAYPVPVDPNAGPANQQIPTLLAQTGTNEYVWFALSIMLIVSGSLLLAKGYTGIRSGKNNHALEREPRRI